MELLPKILLLALSFYSAKARLEYNSSKVEDPLDHGHETWGERIVGGSAASRDEYPYFVSWNGCGASLIAPDIILSAAHCNGIRNNDVIVAAYQKWWGQTSGSAEKRTIVERRAHPDYNSFSLENDFLVMRLDDPITTIEPIELNDSPTFPVVGESLTVIGFGAVFQGGWGPRLLQEVDVNYVSYEKCNEQYNGDIFDDVMLCAGVEGGGKDSCQGDSGGPILKKTSEGHVQVGIVSWGRGCALADYSGVYSRITGAKEWIDSTVCELSRFKPTFCF